MTRAATVSEFTLIQDRQKTAVGIERLNVYINLDHYPLHELDSIAGQVLIAQAHEMIASDTAPFDYAYPIDENNDESFSRDFETILCVSGDFS